MKEMRYMIVIISLFLFIGCGKVNLSMERIDIKGSITSINVSASIENQVDSFLVEGNIEVETGYDKASVKITKDTVIIKDDIKVEATIEYINEDVIVEVQFKEGVAESYPVQATADIIRIISAPSNPKTEETQQEGELPSVNEKDKDLIVEAYMLVIDTFYEEDSGLNGAIKYLAIDTTKMVNLTEDNKKELLTALQKYDLIVLDTTFENLEAEGLIKDLYFEEGILFKIEDQPMSNNKLTLKASKWRSGTGAIGTDEMVLKKVKGTWEVIQESGRWIS